MLVVIIGLAGWRIFAGRVDRTNPDQVATAFIKALKAEQVKKAAAYWVPDGADAWASNAETQMHSWPAGSYGRFFEALPASPTFVKSHNPKSPANEQTLTSDGASVDLRQIDGKWYVCKGPV